MSDVSGKSVLMLCHDQHLDRRVVAQAQSLIKQGVSVTLLALAFGSDGSSETTPEGINLVRISLDDIVPENPIYLAYISRQDKLNDLLNRFSNRYSSIKRVLNGTFKRTSQLNWAVYRFMLLVAYRNKALADPLPFRSAFVKYGDDISCDLIQVHDLPALEAGVQLAKKKGVHLVYDAHELYPEQQSFSSVQKKMCSQAEARLIKHSDYVFAVNKSIADVMAERYEIKMPTVLLNAIDPPEDFDVYARYNLLREKLGLGSDRRILLFQGGYSPHRNLEKLVMAFRYVSVVDVDLVMMGFGALEEKLRSISIRYGLLGKRVHFLPAVPQDELLQHSASADMGIIPYPHVDLNSLYCTPNKLFEFIQAGLPILANDSPELRRFVGDEGFGLLKPMNNVKQIAQAIDEAFRLENEAVWKKQLIERLEYFSWDVESCVYMKAMRTILCTEKSSVLPTNNR